MPPIGRHMVDSLYIGLLAEWIDNLPSDAGKIFDFRLYPNPSRGWVSLRFSDEWEPPFSVYVINPNGIMLKEVKVDTRSSQIDLTALGAGTYFLGRTGWRSARHSKGGYFLDSSTNREVEIPDSWGRRLRCETEG